MSKNKLKRKKKVNTSPPKVDIQDLKDSRNGGQIALRGFTYQFLYSCYLILSECDEKTTFTLEGIEDIDHYKCEVLSNVSTHIQLKYSNQKQDASFLKDVLKNFIEAYLLDETHNFKLVYDFEVAKGNMSKLFSKTLEQKSLNYWKNVIRNIKEENPLWNWDKFSFNEFIKKLTFEKKDKNILSLEIEKQLIKKYNITTDNLALFVNGIEMCCLRKMECRESINQQELNMVIQSIKDDISRGVHNPAHSWIKNLKFDAGNSNKDFSYYEGKKATPQDIAQQLPIRRKDVENEIEESIRNNRVTAIKASSGQGKTTMALQVAYNLRNEYKIYQLLWCNDTKELGNIVQYFKSRVKLGEKPLIIIDNLDSQLSEWNRLAQSLQEEVSYHYKLLLTTREDDWFNYSGDLSNVKSLQVVKLSLNEQEAKNIYEVLKKVQKVHNSILHWRNAWAKVADKKLLIEYIYLLTHGQMLSERVNNQITKINKTDSGRIMCEILRKVCFADVCGIKIPVNKLIKSLEEKTSCDYGELLKSIENEFLIRVDLTDKYVEGLHPVRSQHIVDKLHEYINLSETALQVVKITDNSYLPKLFSNLPHYIMKGKERFYLDIVNALWNQEDLSSYVLALQGLFSGSVMQYYLQNKQVFDDANDHGGLFLLTTELNPFTRFKEFDYSVQCLDGFKKITPDNDNIQYLCNLRDSVSKVELPKTDIYCFSEALFYKLNGKKLFEITNDVTSYSSIAYWLINIDSAFNLSKNVSFERLWNDKSKYSVDVMSSIMYTCFCGNKDMYMLFVEENIQAVITYLKIATKSLKLYLSANEKEIHVEYILLSSDIQKGNEESVSRLKTICKTLPIFNTYCADAIKPTLDIFSTYDIPDESHKTMPLRNLVIMFHQEFSSLWDKTIMSNYESDSVFEWLNHWFFVRKNIVALLDKSVACICKLLESKLLGSLATEIDTLRIQLNKDLGRVFRHPREDRPFEEKPTIPEGLDNIKSFYFSEIQNFSNQLVGFLKKDAEQSRLAIVNLRSAQSSIIKMHKFFEYCVNEYDILQEEHAKLCILEEQSLQNIMIACLYFKEHEPSKHFNKFQIKKWYNEYYQKILEYTSLGLGSLEKYDVVFPKKYNYDGILSFYPIIVHNLDTTDGELLIEFLYYCTPLAELDYDYLIVAFRNDEGEVIPNCLRIPKNFLKQLKIAIENEDATLAEQLTPPFPQEVTQKVLDCFEQKFELLVPKATGYEGIDRIFELLWSFSTYSKELLEDSDMDYREKITCNLKSQILSCLDSYKHKINNEDFEELSQLCSNVFKGDEFDDVMLNNYYNQLTQKILDNAEPTLNL